MIPLVPPINDAQQRHVIETTQVYIQRAAVLLQRDFAAIKVRFDLKGRAAGMYHNTRGQAVIRYNPWLFGKYFHDNLCNTVPHEVAHYLCDVLYGLRRIRPHGREWRELMRIMQAEPQVRHRYDLQGIPQRQRRRYTYQCTCRQHQISVVRHRRMQRGVGYYQCRHCGSRLCLAPIT